MPKDKQLLYSNLTRGHRNLDLQKEEGYHLNQVQIWHHLSPQIRSRRTVRMTVRHNVAGAKRSLIKTTIRTLTNVGKGEEVGPCKRIRKILRAQKFHNLVSAYYVGAA